MKVVRRLLYPLAPGYLAELRRWARAWMMSRHTRVDAGDVVLALTELVGNSVQHGSTPVEVELATTGEKLLLRVSDSSEDLPRQREHHDLAAFEGGRGVLLVERLSARWGVRLNQGGGKTIWCEFAPQP